MLYTVNRTAARVLAKLGTAPRVGSLGLEFSAGWNEKTDRVKGRFIQEWGRVDSWDEAEAAIDAIGLRCLTGRFQYQADGSEELTVRIKHVYDDRIVLTTALTDAVEDVGEEITIPFPAPAALR